MKVNCWDKCFLCLTNLFASTSSSSSCGGKKSRRTQKSKEINEKPNPSVLIKYLLGNWDQNENDSLLQRIRRLQQLQKPSSNSSASSSEGLIKFCEKCQDSARRISHLQIELEVLQMKIVDILWSLRKTVINNSNGHHEGTSGFSLEGSQEVLDTLQAFQAAVVEKSKESVHVPLVYIEKFTGCKYLKTNLATLTVTGEEDNFNLIKTEPETGPLDEILSDFGDDYDHHHVASPIVDFNEIDDFPPPPPRKLQKLNLINTKKTEISKTRKEKSPGKRGRHPRNLAKVESPDTTGLPRQTLTDDLQLQPHNIKDEQAEFLSLTSEQDANLNSIIKQENFTDGTRKSRSAAQTAVKRIADVKNLSKPSFQYRPRKVPKKTRKTKELLKAKKSKQVKTKRKSSSSFSRHPPNPNKILLNAVLKTGKILKPPKPPRKLSKSKKEPEETLPGPRPQKYFHCEICPYRTHLTFQFEHHLRDHETPEVVNHICPHCTNPPRQFSHKQSFDYHMNSHAGLNKMGCDICPKLIGPFIIVEHLRGHPEIEKIFQCSGCSYHCGTREGYLNHIKFHGTAALICDVCSKKFGHRQKMLDHIHKEHNLLEKIKCDVANCDKEFFERKLLDAHKKLHLEAFVCLECDLQFPRMRHLLGHQFQKHSKEKPVQCSECPETFIHKQALQTHLIKAHGAAKFKCPHCPKEYTNQGNLNSHINLHINLQEGISFPCDKCDKSFRDRAILRKHQNVHNTREDFVCEECGKAFRYELLLRTHIKIHIGDKKHKCSYCSKGFVNRQNLICHERIHTGEKPYVCEACGKDFNQRSSLNLHMRKQHKELIAIKNKSEVPGTATGSTSTTTSTELNVG